jgi:predicted nucleic acid-binding protein
MTDTLVDSNVLIDVWTSDSAWADWSTDALEAARDEGELVINPLIYAEVCVPFDSLEVLELAMAPHLFKREALPWEAAFPAAKAFEKYRSSGGARHAPLPDFYIGAHAEVRGYRLLTRDTQRYRTYFPKVSLIAPDMRP